jgi:type II secretory pathway pseudopilin PulG
MMEKTQLNSTLPKHSNGYMLIEALIAIAVFSIGFLAVATLVLSATRNNTNGNILTQANMLARQTLEQVKNTPDITTLPAGPTTSTESGIDAFGNPGGIYTRTTKIEDVLGFDTSRAIEVSVSWKWRGKNRSIVMSTITKGKGI